MIGTACKTEINTSALQTMVAKASRKAMFRAAGFAMTVARRKIRYRSYKMASAPGSAPFKHKNGPNSFSHSIRFAVDPAGTTAVIGPQREPAKPANASGPVPHTLEFGGMTRAGKNIMWFNRTAPETLRTESSVADFLRSRKYVPLFMAESSGAVARAAGTTRYIRRKKAPDFGRTGSGQYKMVYYLSIKARSDRQARRAAKNVIKYFGYPGVAASVIAPRPFMGPTLSEHEGKILSFWQNIVT